MKKLIISLILVVVLFNCISPTLYVYANENVEDNRPTYGSNEIVNNLSDSGTSGNNKKVGASVTFQSGLIGVIVGVFNTLPMVIQTLFSFISKQGLVDSPTTPTEPEPEPTTGTYQIDTAVTRADVEACEFFTIEDIVMNRVPVLSVDFFDLDIVPIENESDDENSIKNVFSRSASIWFNFSRILSLGLALPILMVITIRMATSTIASDKAKYKEMMVHWLASLVVLFLLQYMMTIISALSYLLLSIVKTVAENLVASDPTSFSFEKYIIIKARKQLFAYSGFQIVGISIIYWLLIYYQVKFFMMYLKRMFSITFLMIIAPLITITYPLDKIGDGKAQAYEKWISEYMVNMFIQPIHAFVYTVFMFTAGSICIQAPLLAVLFMLCLSRGEKIIKNLFNMRGKASINSLQLIPKKH